MSSIQRHIVLISIMVLFFISTLSVAGADASGDASGDATIKLPYSGAQAETPQILFCSAVSIWVTEVSEECEYGIRQLGTDTDFQWQDSNLFFGLSKHTSYEIGIRYRETPERQAGGMSILVVDTDDWQYSIRYHLNQGKNCDANSTMFQAGGSVLFFSSPTRKNYQFVGWYEDAKFSKPITSWSCVTEKNLHVYAKWRKVNQEKITGVDVSLKGKNKIKIEFNPKETASQYEIQYSTSSKFADSETVTWQTKGDSYTTPELSRGMKYYIRIRSISWDSCGNTLYGDYSTVKTKSTKALSSGSSSVENGTLSKTSTKEDSKTTKKTVKKVRKVKVVQKGNCYLSAGDTIQLKLPSQVKTTKSSPKVPAKWKKLRITVSNKKVATVNKKGVVKAKKEGKTKVVLRRNWEKYIYTIVVEQVSLTENKLGMVVGDSHSIELSKAVSKVKWTSSKPSVAKVNKNGKITAVGAGTATITADYHDHTYKAQVRVITVEQKKINQTKDFYFSTIYTQLEQGQDYSIPYEAEPAGLSAADITWYTSDARVATVKNGVVHGVAPGTAVISVKYQKKTANMRIQVIAYEWQREEVRLISHRGSSKAPENSLQAFEMAANSGYSYVETDIRWTKDNVPVLLHDSTIGRTSDSLLDLKLSSLTYEECQELDFGIKFGEEFKNTRIVRFDDFLNVCKNRGLHCYIELKGTIYREQSKLLAELIRYYGMEGQVTFISFSINSLVSMQELLPEARMGYLCSEVSESNIESLEELEQDFSEVFLDISYTTPLSLKELQLLGNAGVVFECYTVDSMELANQAVSQGAVGITTDMLLPEDYRKQKGE